MAFQFRKPFNIKDNAFDPDGHKYVYKAPKGNYLLKLLKSDKTKPTKQGEVPVAVPHIRDTGRPGSGIGWSLAETVVALLGRIQAWCCSICSW